MAKQKHSYKSRAARRDEILLTAHDRMVHANKRKFTNAAMAKWLGLSASSRLKGILEELVEDGWLSKAEAIHREWQGSNGGYVRIIKHEYSLTEATLQELSII